MWRQVVFIFFPLLPLSYSHLYLFIVWPLRSTASIEKCVAECLSHFGRLDYLVYNAGAIWWAKVKDTPTKRFLAALLHSLNWERELSCLQLHVMMQVWSTARGELTWMLSCSANCAATFSKTGHRPNPGCFSSHLFKILQRQGKVNVIPSHDIHIRDFDRTFDCIVNHKIGCLCN